MKYLIISLILFSTIVCKPPQAGQSASNHISDKKQEQKDLDSLFIINSLPINVIFSKDFKRIDLQDSLIKLLKERKYKCLDKSANEALFKAKQFEMLQTNDPVRMREMIEKGQNDKNYLRNLMLEADPYVQTIVVSILKYESGINYINVRRSNLPNAIKQRDWVFTYQDSAPSGDLAARILDTLINKKNILNEIPDNIFAFLRHHNAIVCTKQRLIV